MVERTLERRSVTLRIGDFLLWPEKAPPGGLASSPPQYRFLIAGSDITPLLTLEPNSSFCESW
jgi:hypothetical protein